ncbi:hypothetical protein LguiB_002886 [Lonicera macranthoides]
MVFSANPLALSVPEPAFETWLRDSGYLEIIDQRTSDLHRLSSSSSSASPNPTTDADSSTTINSGFFLLLPIFSYIGTLLSLLTLNPFSKVTTDDLSGDTPSWTRGFIGLLESYSFPSSPSQARLRVHENARRYARNYAFLFLLFFACSLYQIPLALVGLISSLALWDLFRFYGNRWGLDWHPVIRQTLVRVAQCATAVILFCSNVQLALLCSLGVGYAVMILHASFRKLTPVKKPTGGRH